MSIELTISKIDSELISAFATLDSWFDHVDELFKSRISGRPNATGVLEYLTINNRYFLKLIDQGDWTVFSSSSANFVDQFPFYQHPNLWENKRTQLLALDPGYLPKEMRALKEIRRELRDQLYQCLCLLDALSFEDNTHRKSSTAKSHAYQALYLIALYIKKHTAQLDKHYTELH